MCAHQGKDYRLQWACRTLCVFNMARKGPPGSRFTPLVFTGVATKSQQNPSPAPHNDYYLSIYKRASVFYYYFYSLLINIIDYIVFYTSKKSNNCAYINHQICSLSFGIGHGLKGLQACRSVLVIATEERQLCHWTDVVSPNC